MKLIATNFQWLIEHQFDLLARDKFPFMSFMKKKNNKRKKKKKKKKKKIGA